MTTVSTPAGALPLPHPFGRYTLFDHIGRGGMAEIYLARARTELGATRLVVVKQMLPELASNPAFSDMLISEAKLAARLNHANVVQVTDLGRHEGRLFIAMEYVEGFDLNELLRRCSRAKVPLPIEFSLLIVIETLRGLDYAHRRVDDQGRPLNLVHRDVSPSNVLVSFEGEVKLCDFGIAHANDAADERQRAVLQGKAGYMSPEHARGEPLDARADVFAAGIILWELLAGRRYYRAAEGQPLIEVARRAEFQPPPSRGLVNEGELYALIGKALSPDREGRFASAQTMLRELEAYTARAGMVASSLRLGAWLREHFANETIERRRGRERALRALEAGPPVVLSAVDGATLPERPPPFLSLPPPPPGQGPMPAPDLSGFALDVTPAPTPAAPAILLPSDPPPRPSPISQAQGGSTPASSAPLGDGPALDAATVELPAAGRLPAGAWQPPASPEAAPPASPPSTPLVASLPAAPPSGAGPGPEALSPRRAGGRGAVVGAIVVLLVLGALIGYRLL